MDVETLFWELFKSPIEANVEAILKRYNLIQNPENWRAYGGIESNYGVVENQQASPIPALIEKITNSIDAVLMRKCVEQGIDPRSEDAPRSINEALNLFFPDHKNWDLRQARRNQAEMLQIIADGPRGETSLVIFDDGEGQAPEDFEDTFLSLLRGNKNDIHFVQGKYNMGGAGAIAFCGKHRFQLICSRRFDSDGPIGFTLVRRHPLTKDEEKVKKSTWYEYLVIDGKIASFTAAELNLGLYGKQFRTGTAIKLYSYDLPAGSRSVISRDLNQSINEYLFNPALPVFTIDQVERYPNDRELERELYGLKRRLEEDDSRYIDQFFSEEIVDEEIGHLRVTCYVFKSRVDKRTVKETRDTIGREFFKNNMSVLFSMNGQVHGNYTTEFISRSLKLPLLRDYLLIHVDCTETNTSFRNELFMASRDRLKEGEESRMLRRKLSDLLARGRLKDIHTARKASITVDSNDTDELIRNLTRHLPLNKELSDLLSQTFKLEDDRDGRKDQKAQKKRTDTTKEKPVFSPQRFPSFFKIDLKTKEGQEIPMISLPLGGDRTIRFSTDVEDHYFDRVSEPGELQISLLNLTQNESDGGDKTGEPSDIESILNVVKSSPNDGTIRVQMKPTEDGQIGDVIKIQASLSSPEKQLEEVFLVKITEPEKKSNSSEKGDQPDNRLGLPQLVMVYKDADRGETTWEKMEESSITMNHEVVVFPLVEDDTLSAVYINMDSNALLSHRSKLTKEDAISVAEKRYVSAVYFHTLFLYVITKNRKYGIVKQFEDKEDQSIEVTEYISDLFGTFYAQFLLNFDTQELIAALEA